MSLVVVDEGLIRACRLLAADWPNARKIGLFRNDITIDRHATIDDFEAASFSGYDGERDISGWSPPAMEGQDAVSRAAPIIWTCDGGVPSGYVFGYYVVDEDGELLWAERRGERPVAMVAAGQDYTVVPVITARTQFGGET